MDHRQQDILQQRAAALAQPDHVEHDGLSLAVVEFRLAHEIYAFELIQVKKVVAVSHLVPLPGAPAFVAGITHYAGHILSVVDLRTFFDLPQTRNDQHKLVILRARSMQMAVLAEEVIGVRDIDESKLQDSLPTLTGVRARYLRGVTADQTIVLDVEKMLADQQLIVNQS